MLIELLSQLCTLITGQGKERERERRERERERREGERERERRDRKREERDGKYIVTFLCIPFRGGGPSVAKTLDLLKAVLQPSFNQEVKRLCDDYLQIFTLAAGNIRENTRDNVPEATIRVLVHKMMEEVCLLSLPGGGAPALIAFNYFMSPGSAWLC